MIQHIYKYGCGTERRMIPLALLSLMFLATSCNDWLDVSPIEERKKSELFSKPEGYRNVLTGVYIRMKSNDLYGQELVCGTIENLAQHWRVSSKGSVGQYLSTYNYKATTVETAMSNIYNHLYEVVADVNGLLGSVDSGVLSEDDYNLIKGEALALRAFCHFDVLRMFGPMPNSKTGDKILPYVKQVSHQPNRFVNYDEFTKNLLADLDEAESCLNKVDPITKNSIEDLNVPSKLKDNYYGYRQMRFNYYAVCALKARVALWMGEKAKALEYAQKVIEAKTPSGGDMFRLGTQSDCAGGDKVLSPEHVFNLKVNALSTTLGTGNTYQQPKKNLEVYLYDKGTTDIRYVNMWNEVYDNNTYTRANYFLKYEQTEKMPDLSKNVIPIIRLSEMYLIAMECSRIEEANIYYQKLCTARNANYVMITEDKIRETLIKEYNREFYGEGQAFYAYKRMGVEEIFFSQEKGTKEVYVVPLPIKESIYIKE